MTKSLVSAEDQNVQAYVTAHSQQFKMKPIQARLPNEDELGQVHTTYVLDQNGEVVAEGNNTYSDEKVVVRFPTELSEGLGVFNEWLVKKEAFQKKYGDLPTSSDWGDFEKEGLENLAVIDEGLMEIFGAEPGVQQVEVGVSWASDGKMIAFIGGLATGYHVIAPSMAKIMYDKV